MPFSRYEVVKELPGNGLFHEAHLTNARLRDAVLSSLPPPLLQIHLHFALAQTLMYKLGRSLHLTVFPQIHKCGMLHGRWTVQRHTLYDRWVVTTRFFCY
jgi:hypothetical protein